MVNLLGAGKSYDTSKQVLKENQIVVHHGMGASETRFVVHRVEYQQDRYIYHLINTETREHHQTDLVRPLHEKFGIGMYYNAQQLEFMDGFEVLMLYSETESQTDAKQESQQNEQADQTETASRIVLGNFIVVVYSEKALAVFGDTRPIKEELKALGGRFNPKLSHDGVKKAGWIFQKSKENELRNLLTIK